MDLLRNQLKKKIKGGVSHSLFGILLLRNVVEQTWTRILLNQRLVAAMYVGEIRTKSFSQGWMRQPAPSPAALPRVNSRQQMGKSVFNPFLCLVVFNLPEELECWFTQVVPEQRTLILRYTRLPTPPKALSLGRRWPESWLSSLLRYWVTYHHPHFKKIFATICFTEIFCVRCSSFLRCPCLYRPTFEAHFSTSCRNFWCVACWTSL